MRKSIIILLFSLLGLLSARAYDFEVDGIYYNIISDTCVEVTSGSVKYFGAVVIPATVDYEGTLYAVTKIGYEAFGYCANLTSITIPEHVDTIGADAFYGCSGLTSVEWNAVACQDFHNAPFSDSKNIITSITFGNQVSHIPAYLCNGMRNITSVTIPNSVTSIGRSAFYGCSGLTSVTIPESVSKIGLNAFGVYGVDSDLSLYYAGDIAQWCGIEFGERNWGESWNNGFSLYINNQKLVDLALPDGMTAIEGGPFYNCSGLTSVMIPNSVTSIGRSAFYGCSGLTSVTIPEGVTHVGFGAFDRCSGLTSVEWNAIACQDIINEDGGYPIDKRFEDCNGLTDITFGNQVTYIPACLCYGCSGLTSVTIPNSVTSIGLCAFKDCSGLTSVMIPNSVTSIGRSAFYGCSGLTSVTIPESVDTIDSYAFYGCTSISSPLFNSKIFAYLPQNHNGEYAIPSGIQTIAGGAFSGCIGLTSVTIPESVTSIGWWSFYQCTGLTTVTIPERVISIGWQAFEYCTGLISMTIGTGVTSIGVRAFSGCSGLTSVTIPNSVTSIGQSAFYGCSGLTSVTIGKSVDTIGINTFGGCNNLLSVTSLSKIPPYCGYDIDFGYANGPSFSFYEGTLFVPSGCKMVYQTAPEWYKFSRIEELASAGTATVTVRPNDASMGTVIGGGEYELDEQVTLVAIPNNGHHFVKWDDGKAANPRILTIEGDITLTAIFAKDGDNTPNETSEANNFRIYAQDRTIHLSEARGAVQVYNMAGQCVYNGTATAIPVSQSGVYIVAVGSQRFKVLVR